MAMHIIQKKKRVEMSKFTEHKRTGVTSRKYILPSNSYETLNPNMASKCFEMHKIIK